MSNLRLTAASLISLSVVSCSQQSAEKSPEQIWRDASSSIVQVTARGVDGTLAQGSGFFVNLEGKRWILTNRHVVNSAEEVTIAPQGKNPKRAPSYKVSPNLDLAVVECPADLNTPPLALAKEEMHPGAEVFALGFPLGLTNVITRGIVGAVEDNYFLFDASVSSGNSGGPVVNRAGRVVGVATMGSHGIEGAVVQNLNVGIRISAVPRLQVFSDPLFRISSVSNRIRETEHFIEQGFLREDFFTLGELLRFEWMQEIANAHGGGSADWQKKVVDSGQTRDTWQAKHGAIRDGVKRWIDFLKKCEEKIDAIPAAFVGLGNDPLLEQFLKTDVGLKLERVNATPENLSELARIGADHWLARFEDLRYHLEWLIRYGNLPSDSELDNSGERPAIRLKFSITGNREADLEQYRQTLLSWLNREDVIHDSITQIEQWTSGKTGTDPITNEKLHGNFLKQVSSWRQYLAVGTGDRGKIDQAINLLRRDLEDRSPSSWSGALLAEYLVFAGRSDDAWLAYREYFLSEPPFDAFALKQDRDLNGDPILHDIVDRFSGFAAGGIGRPPNSPDIKRRITQWNSGVEIVNGRRLEELGPLLETLSDDWFNKLDDLSKLRVLLYYRYIRYFEEKEEYRAQTGKFPDGEYTVKKQAEFTDALHTSKDAEAIWTRATVDRHLDPPL